MKQNFDDIVLENTAWIYKYIRSRTDSREIAEDLAQEVWLKAFRAYDSYIEDGRLRRWLMRIAQNTVRSYYAEPVIISCISLDSRDDNTDPLIEYLADESLEDPEEKLLHNELVSDVLAAIEKLPEKHRSVMTYRFVYDLSVSETAQRMNIPEGSVKSAAHYAIEKIKKELKIDEIPNRKGDRMMDCRETYKYLFVYALGKLDDDKRAEIKKHLDECEKCRDMAEALEKLIPHLPKADGDGTSHYCISFPEIGNSYSAVCIEIENYEELNKILAKRNGVIPDDENWMNSGHGSSLEKIGEFLNEGEEIFFRSEQSSDNPGYVFCKVTYLPKLYHKTWQYSSYISIKEETFGKDHNHLGCDAHTALYQAVPENHGKLKMKRGNGFIDCGKHTFAYAESYLRAEDTLYLEYTFN